MNLKKLWITLVLSLVMTLPTISQNVTINGDTIVCIPKTHLVKAIQEIELGDFCKEELQLVKGNYEIVNQQLHLKDSIIIQYQLKESTFLRDIQNLNQVIQHKEDLRLISEKKAKKYKRQKNGMLIGGAAATIGIIILRLVL